MKNLANRKTLTIKKYPKVGQKLKHIILALGVLWTGALYAETLPQSRQEITLSFAPIVRNAAPSIVNLYGKPIVRQRFGLFNDPFFSHFFGRNFGNKRSLEARSLGSGVIVHEEGIIVTNHHVISGAEDLRIVLSDRREFEAELLLADKRIDIAVLRIGKGKEKFPALPWRNSDEVEIGDLVLAIGNPFGLDQTVTSGIVSALARDKIGVAEYEAFIQTDAPINPGNSGGALVTMDGKLLGINTAIVSRSGGSVGIGFAVPSNLVRLVVASARKGGKVIRPWRGALFQEVTPELVAHLGLEKPKGAMIVQLEKSGPLQKAGLRVGDVITRLDGHNINKMADLAYRFATGNLGERAKIVFSRDGKEKNTVFTFLAPPETPPRNERELSGRTPFSGLQIVNINPALIEELRLNSLRKGVMILGVKQRSVALRVGFQRGDIIDEVNDRKIKSVQELVSLLEKTQDKWEITILRRGQRITASFR
ncbi:MAG: Do family serine endopeptidase [Parvibaculales bacterium]